MGNFLDAWYPATSDFGLIEAPTTNVVAAFLEWQAAIGRAPIESTRTSLESTFTALAPLSAELRRAAFVPTKSAWTAYFASGLLGSDPFPVMSHLAQHLQVRAMRVCSTTERAHWPATIWEVYAPESLGGSLPLGYLRSVACANDGGRWTFETSGQPFPFERLERYTAKRKKDCFDRQLLIDYLQRLGLRPFDADFFTVSTRTPSSLVENRQRWASPPKEFSFDEVQRGVPWAKS
ncbi:MAG TPA: hypothetical protein VG937_34800 [Polyangiaceae bacterium]|nr:hypothetical protein [Polyangiaceae bacterium]